MEKLQTPDVLDGGFEVAARDFRQLGELPGGAGRKNKSAGVIEGEVARKGLYVFRRGRLATKRIQIDLEDFVQDALLELAGGSSETASHGEGADSIGLEVLPLSLRRPVGEKGYDGEPLRDRRESKDDELESLVGLEEEPEGPAFTELGALVTSLAEETTTSRNSPDQILSVEPTRLPTARVRLQSHVRER